MRNQALRVALLAVRAMVTDPQIHRVIDAALEDPGPTRRAPLTQAERARNYRLARHENRHVKSDDRHETRHEIVTEKVTNSDGKSDASGPRVARTTEPNLLDLTSETRDPEREEGRSPARPAVTIVTKTVTEAVTNSDAFRDDLRDAPRTITNATADACFGLAVAAWAEGVRAGTGRPFTMPRGGTQELAKLVDTLVTHCPDVEARTGWARAKGEAFARAGGKLSTHTFADWCNSPSTGIRRATPPVQAPPAGGRRWKVGGG